MKIFLILTLIIFSSLFSACSSGKTEAASNEEIIFDDGFKKPAADEVVFDDLGFTDMNDAGNENRASAESITAEDNSQISIMTDNYGNKSEKRCFKNHPRLQCVILVTSPIGEKQVTLNGRSGEPYRLPENMFDRILTASADELANAAGIIENKSSRTVTVGQVLGKPENNQPLQPMPSYKFPVQNTMPAQAEASVEAAPPVTEKPAENVPEAKDDKFQEQNGAIAPERENEKPKEN